MRSLSAEDVYLLSVVFGEVPQLSQPGNTQTFLLLFVRFHPDVSPVLLFPRMHMQPRPSTAPVSARLHATPS